MPVHLHCHISEPRDRGHATVFILGLHAEVRQPYHLPAWPRQQVGTGSLEVIEEAIEGVVVWVTEDHAGAGADGLAVEGPLLLLTGLQLAAGCLLTLNFVVHV